MSLSKTSLHEAMPSPAQPNCADFDARMEKLMELLKDYNGERTLILGSCDNTTRRVLMKLHCLTPKTRLQPLGFMKYVLDDNDYGLIKELEEFFEKNKRTIGICNKQIFERVDFGKIDKVIIFDFPTGFKLLHQLLKCLKIPKIDVITTPNDPKENIETVKKIMEKESRARDAPTVAGNVFPYPNEDDFFDWDSEDDEEEEFDEEDYDYSHLEEY